MNILLMSRYTEAGSSSRYRSYLYLRYLRGKGHEITVAPLLDDRYIERLYARQRKPMLDIVMAYVRRIGTLLTSGRYDLVWIEGEMFPWLPYWLDAMFLKTGVPYVVDYDDALFHKYDLHSSSAVRTMLGSKIDLVMKHAACVIAGNQYLAERASKAGARRIAILPTVVDTDQYRFLPMPANRVFTIGWIGSLSTAKHLTEIEESLRIVSRTLNARLVTVGIRSLALSDVNVDVVVPWSEAIEIEQMMNFDVGIMPLTDSPWERGKCGHKLIKYMSCGRPVVASPVGINTQIVEHGVNGFFATGTGEWVGMLSKLHGDRALCGRMGEAGRTRVEEEYSLRAMAPKLENILSQAAAMGERG